jgi:hypothetical protein
VHVAPPLQLTEHCDLQMMWHVEPPEQSTLPLWSTVMSHVDVPVHLRLHDDPHSPVQTVVFSQSSVQLAPQLPVVMSHVVFDGHVHVEP